MGIRVPPVTQDVINPNTTEEGKILKLGSPEGMGICLALFAVEEQRQKQASMSSTTAASTLEEDEVEELLAENNEADVLGVGAGGQLQALGLPGQGLNLPRATRYRDIKIGQHEVELDVRGNVSVSGTLLGAQGSQAPIDNE